MVESIELNGKRYSGVFEAERMTGRDSHSSCESPDSNYEYNVYSYDGHAKITSLVDGTTFPVFRFITGSVRNSQMRLRWHIESLLPSELGRWRYADCETYNDVLMHAIYMGLLNEQKKNPSRLVQLIHRGSISFDNVGSANKLVGL